MEATINNEETLMRSGQWIAGASQKGQLGNVLTLN